MADKTISGKSVVKTAPVEVSPISTLPPGLDEGKYVVNDGTESEVLYTELDMPPVVETGGTTLDVPQNVFIKSQTLRFNPDGSITVDVVVGFDEVKGALDYDVRSAVAAGS